MKKIIIIGCIILTLPLLVHANGQSPPEKKPPEVPKESPPELIPKCKNDEIFKDGRCVKKEMPKEQGPPEIKPPEAPKKGIPELIPK